MLIEYVISGILLALLTIGIVLFVRNKRLMQARLFQCQVLEWEKRMLKKDLINKLKNKIALTQCSEIYKMNAEALIARCIYVPEARAELESDISLLFAREVSVLSTQYPQLTELDKLVIILLGVGLDNIDICLLLHMEKRTLYRRRQLIAHRLGLSSVDLETVARNLLQT